jgi:methionyl-tRNA synthetase
LDDFQNRVNSDLVGKVVNIASRCAGFITKNFDGILSERLDNPELVAELSAAAPKISECYESRDFARAMRDIMRLADSANQYIDARKPWVLAKQEGSAAELHEVCTTGIALFRVLMIYLKPVLPAMAIEVEKFLNHTAFRWSDAELQITGQRINKFKPLMQRIEAKKVEAMIGASKATDVAQNPALDEGSETAENFISIDDFAKIDLRVAKVIAAEPIEAADKLLELTLEVGDATRTVFAGIKSAYEPSTLVGRHVILVANLKPRKMRFGISEGMVLAAGPGGEELFLLSADDGAVSGMKAK